MTETIRIIVNGISESVPAESRIADLIARFKEADPDLIVELNGRFVFRQEYAQRGVSAGDRIEFINPNFGG
jgi:thiamine biosynthesis protein ThiS